MKYVNTYSKEVKASQVALGCMRIADMNEKQADEYFLGALELGYNYFDHADIYGRGRAEEVFGGIIKRHGELRDRIIIQTKCSIKNGAYDSSKEHILWSVDNSLRKLNVEKLDVLLLHRPDLLIEPEEVAEAFEILKKSGKVDEFGVSNYSPMQIELLKKYVKQKLVINQMQLSLASAKMISNGANVNLANNDGVVLDGYIRDYCRLNEITVQPWSPLQYGFIEGAFVDNDKFPLINERLKAVAEKYGVTKTGVAIAWILRLPEKMQPIVGSTNLDRLKEIAKASEISLDRQDWYDLYRSAGYQLP